MKFETIEVSRQADSVLLSHDGWQAELPVEDVMRSEVLRDSPGIHTTVHEDRLDERCDVVAPVGYLGAWVKSLKDRENAASAAEGVSLAITPSQVAENLKVCQCDVPGRWV